MDMRKDSVSKVVEFFQGKTENKGCSSVKQNNNIMNNKNMNKMANFSFLTIAHSSFFFFFSLDTYSWTYIHCKEPPELFLVGG